jgi:hypothetical protein
MCVIYHGNYFLIHLETFESNENYYYYYYYYYYCYYYY